MGKRKDAKKAAAKELSQTVYIVREGDGEDTYLAIYEDIDAIGNGDIVGVYELAHVYTKSTNHSLI